MATSAEERARVAARRDRIVYLRIKGFSSVEITKQLITEGLIDSPTFDTAYRLVRKDVSRIAAKLMSERGEGDEEALLLFDTEIYIRRLEGIFRDAVLANSYRDAITAAEKIAAAQRVATEPKQEIDMRAKFDLARAAAEAVIRKKKQREATGP